jgi:hypothetical protein
MSISDARLQEFIDLWEQAYGERLSTGEARSTAARLVRFYQLIMRPLPEGPPPQSESGP